MPLTKIKRFSHVGISLWCLQAYACPPAAGTAGSGWVFMRWPVTASHQQMLVQAGDLLLVELPNQQDLFWLDQVTPENSLRRLQDADLLAALRLQGLDDRHQSDLAYRAESSGTTHVHLSAFTLAGHTPSANQVSSLDMEVSVREDSEHEHVENVTPPPRAITKPSFWQRLFHRTVEPPRPGTTPPATETNCALTGR